MKIRSVLQILAILLLGALASAQDAPKAAVSFDYSFARFAPSASYTQGHNLNGGGGAVTFNVHRNVGIMLDFQGYNSNNVKFTIAPSTDFPQGASATVSGNLFTYLFGPVGREYYHWGNVYADLLFGGAHSTVYDHAYGTICRNSTGVCTSSASPSGDSFAMSVGGGIEIPINDRLDFRVGQLDYLYTQFSNQFANTGQSNFRVLTGLTIRMGKLTPRPQQ